MICGTHKGLLGGAIPFHIRESESGRSKSGSISSMFGGNLHEPLTVGWRAVILLDYSYPIKGRELDKNIRMSRVGGSSSNGYSLEAIV